MGQGVRTGLGMGASPVSYRHNFLVYHEFTYLHRQTHPLTYQKYIKISLGTFLCQSTSPCFPIMENSEKLKTENNVYNGAYDDGSFDV